MQEALEVLNGTNVSPLLAFQTLAIMAARSLPLTLTGLTRTIPPTLKRIPKLQSTRDDESKDARFATAAAPCAQIPARYSAECTCRHETGSLI